MNEEHEKFIEDLQEILIKNLQHSSEEICRWCSCSLMHESINVLYQNSPRKEDFENKCKEIFYRILTLFLKGKT